MKITRCHYRETQQSLLTEERSEMRCLMEVTHKGKTGYLRMDADYYKRDADTDYYCDIPGVTADTLAYGYKQDPPFYVDEECYKLTPDHTTLTPEIDAHLIRLCNHRI